MWNKVLGLKQFVLQLSDYVPWKTDLDLFFPFEKAVDFDM